MKADVCPLTPRLSQIAALVPPCRTAADIGTDHAYIPIYLIQTGKVQSAIASDVVPGPVMRARENISHYGLDDRIEVKVANGLDGVSHADTIIIAGMGGNLICDILSAGMAKAKTADILVLQPMTAIYEVRTFLHQQGFSIVAERLAKEEDKMYTVLVAKKGVQQYQSQLDYHIGPLLKKDPLLPEFLDKKVRALDKVIATMAHSQNSAVVEKMRKTVGYKQQLLELKESLL